MPPLTVRAVAGIQSVTIVVHSQPRTIVHLTNLHGAQQKTFKGLTINTHGLSSGVHTVIVTVVDTRGKRATKVIPFAICRPKPQTPG